MQPSPRLLLSLVFACACDIGSVRPDGEGGGGGGGDGAGGDGGVGVAGRYHPVDFAAPEQHGPELELQAQDCRACHGADLGGAATAQNAPSCDSCHTPSDPPAWRSDCTFCHGGDDNDTGAPPRDLGAPVAGVSFPGHTSHVTQGIAAAATCTECHAAVEDVLTPGHAFDDSAGVAEVEMSGGRSPAGAYADGTCSNLYCHGSGRGDDGVAQVDMEAPTCAGCHPSIASSSADWSTMSGDHRRHLGLGYGCEECHQSVTTDSTAIAAPLLHVDRQNQVVFLAATISYAPANRRCTGSCHGENHDDSW